MFNSRAQGTIEYLVILAVIVVISLIVVVLMANSTAPAGTISAAQSKLYWETQPVRINEAVADPQGDAIISVSPQETLTIETITIDGVEKKIENTKIIGGNEQTIILANLIECSGETATYTINSITGTNENGFPVIISEAPIVIECTEDVSEDSVIDDDYIQTFDLGTIENPIEITTCLELQDISSQLDANYILTQNIDCSASSTWNNNEGFIPIGQDYDLGGSLGADEIFSGTLNGDNYFIEDLYIDKTGVNRVGLFSYLPSSAVIKNLGVVDANIFGAQRVGIIVGENYGEIIDSYSTGNVFGTYAVGGLVGNNANLVERTYSDANLLVNAGMWGSFAGGLVGWNLSTVKDSYSTGVITANQLGSAGLVGANYQTPGFTATITNSYSRAKVIQVDGEGLTNNNIGSVSSSYWDTDITPQGSDGVGKTTFEMMQETTFVDWDFTDTWQICEGTSYPFLQWEGSSC